MSERQQSDTVNDYALEPLRHEDIPRCTEIEAELFAADDPWSARAFDGELAAGHYYLGAHSGGELVGFAGLALNGGEPAPEGEVHTIGVTRAWQGRGIGAALLAALLRRADEVRAPVFLEVRTDNAAAIALYERYGFRTVGLRRHYYSPSGADAYTMRREASSVGA